MTVRVSLRLSSTEEAVLMSWAVARGVTLATVVADLIDNICAQAITTSVKEKEVDFAALTRVYSEIAGLEVEREPEEHRTRATQKLTLAGGLQIVDTICTGETIETAGGLRRLDKETYQKLLSIGYEIESRSEFTAALQSYEAAQLDAEANF